MKLYRTGLSIRLAPLLVALCLALSVLTPAGSVSASSRALERQVLEDSICLSGKRASQGSIREAKVGNDVTEVTEIPDPLAIASADQVPTGTGPLPDSSTSIRNPFPARARTRAEEPITNLDANHPPKGTSVPSTCGEHPNPVREETWDCATLKEESNHLSPTDHESSPTTVLAEPGELAKPGDPEETSGGPLGFVEEFNLVALILLAGALVLGIVAAVIALVSMDSMEEGIPSTGPGQFPGQRRRDRNLPLTTPINSGGEARREGANRADAGSGPPRLILLDIAGSGWQVDVPVRGFVTIGRSPENRVVVELDQSVSSFHCEIYRQNGWLWARDVGSLNGTFVDGSRISPRQPVRIDTGSLLKLGNISLSVMVR